MSTEASAKTAWNVPLRPDDVPEAGLHLDLAADEATRAKVAALAGIRALPHFGASLDAVAQGSGLRVTGEVVATVEQTCVVTLESMTSELHEPIDIMFIPPGAFSEADETTDDIDVDAIDVDAIDVDAADESEPLVDGVADLGVVLTELLLLAIDPYPRKPDAVFEPPPSDDAGAHPFAALAALKKPADEG